MQATKLDNGQFQIISTKQETAPDGTTYTRTYAEITNVALLNTQLAACQETMTDLQIKIAAIKALPSN